jgi:hypothetical protein
MVQKALYDTKSTQKGGLRHGRIPLSTKKALSTEKTILRHQTSHAGTPLHLLQQQLSKGAEEAFLQ